MMFKYVIHTGSFSSVRKDLCLDLYVNCLFFFYLFSVVKNRESFLESGNQREQF